MPDRDALALLQGLLQSAATWPLALVAGPLRTLRGDAAPRVTLQALSQSPDSVCVADAGGRILWVNRAFERATGYGAGTAVGQSLQVLHSGLHAPEFYEEMWGQLRAGECFTGELITQRADGDCAHEDVVITPVPGRGGEARAYVRLARDVSERKRREVELEERAYYDALTGLPSPRLLRERSKQILPLARRHGQTAALLHIDIRDLRGINQRLGRDAGDAVLRSMAERLRQGLRESDTMARLGSDEFLVLLSEVPEEESTARVVKRLHESLCREVLVADRSVAIDAHVGVALYPQDGTTIDELAECAEAAMLRAQRTAAAFEFFSPELSAVTREHLELAEDLHSAWEGDQLVLYYQPICATGSGELVGAEALARGEVIGLEALARWPHRERGLLLPQHFIPLAERTGRIVALDRWAIAASVKQAAAWAADGWNGWVSVNLSARTVQDAGLAEYVERILDTYRLPPRHLVLEITESTAMRDPAGTARVLQALKRIGLSIAVDDFGIGHSSLAYLKHFPVDLLKLDCSFIQEIGRDRRDEDLLEIMISLAHRIGAKVVAEGVERGEQWEWLQRAGCDYIQGFLLGRPGPAHGHGPGRTGASP